MKWVLWISIVLQGMLFAEEMEVRSYRVGLAHFSRAYHEYVDPGDPHYWDDDWREEKVLKVPFESAF